MVDSELDLSGLEEFQDCLNKAVKLYPDKAQRTLELLGKGFKNRAIKITVSAVNTYSGNLIKGYKVDPVKGYGINMEVDFRGTAKHFHLIENGHELTTKTGKIIGFVPGRLMVKQCRDEYSEVVPATLKLMTDEIIRECGLGD